MRRRTSVWVSNHECKRPRSLRKKAYMSKSWYNFASNMSLLMRALGDLEQALKRECKVGQATIFLKDELVLRAKCQLNDELRAELEQVSKATQLKKDCCLRYPEIFTTSDESRRKLHIDLNIAQGELKNLAQHKDT